MAIQEINARVSNGTIIEWGFNPETDKHYIRILDDDGAWSLNPRNGAEALDMFQHTFLYDWTLDVPNAMNPDKYIYDVARGELVPR
jgi:hypothetical protein